MRETSINVQAQLKALRLNGMATAWADLTEQGGDTALAASRCQAAAAAASKGSAASRA